MQDRSTSYSGDYGEGAIIYAKGLASILKNSVLSGAVSADRSIHSSKKQLLQSEIEQVKIELLSLKVASQTLGTLRLFKHQQAMRDFREESCVTVTFLSELANHFYKHG